MCSVKLYEDVARIWDVHRNMWARCTNPKNKVYRHYGGRGITVCADWRDFETFCQWALDGGFRQGLQLDRIDNDGPYAPENCRWATRIENGNNKRNNRRITAFGETKTFAEWARDARCKVGPHVVATRIRDGWEAERAVTQPSTRVAPRCINGHSRRRYTIVRPNGHRLCRRCHADRSRRQYRRRMEAKRAAAGQYN